MQQETKSYPMSEHACQRTGTGFPNMATLTAYFYVHNYGYPYLIQSCQQNNGSFRPAKVPPRIGV